MARGGRRVPRDKTPKVSGVGRYAKRTDNLPIRVPNVGESTDLTQGDRAKLEAAQRITPVRRAPVPQARFQPPTSAAPALRRGELPQFLFERPTDRPLEPETAGMDIGPGPGSEVLAQPPEPDDDKEFVLQMLATGFGGRIEGSQAAADMLRDIQAAKAQPAPVLGGQLDGGMGLSDLDEEEAEPTPIDLPIPAEEAPEQPPLEPELPETEEVVPSQS